MAEEESPKSYQQLDFHRASGIISAGQFGGKLIERSTPKSCRRRRISLCAAATVLLFAMGCCLYAQQMPAGPSGPAPPQNNTSGATKGPVLKAESDLTLVYVTV